MFSRTVCSVPDLSGQNDHEIVNVFDKTTHILRVFLQAVCVCTLINYAPSILLRLISSDLTVVLVCLINIHRKQNTAVRFVT